MRQRIREAIIVFGLTRPVTHWLTLNCHRRLSVDAAFRRLKRWRVEMLRRLHGRQFYVCPEDQCFNFFGGVHLAAYDEPHFHLACFVPAAVLDKFKYYGPTRWKSIVPSGTFHLEEIDDSPVSPRQLLGYALKPLNVNSQLSFVDSRLLH